jgi:hypothetical protein
MTHRRWMPALVASLLCGMLTLPNPALACMNEMANVESREGNFSFVVALTAIVALFMILRPVLDGAGSFRAIIAAWLSSAVMLGALNLVIHALGWPRLHEAAVGAAFGLSLLIAPTYRLVRERVLQRRTATEMAANEAPPEAPASQRDAAPVDPPSEDERAA